MAFTIISIEFSTSLPRSMTSATRSSNPCCKVVPCGILHLLTNPQSIYCQVIGRPGASSQKLPRLLRLSDPSHRRSLGHVFRARALFSGTQVAHCPRYKVGARLLASPLAHEQSEDYSPQDEDRER